MATSGARKMFVNLPVHDLKRSTEFFSTLGFEFNPQFTDDKAACMVVSGEAFVMLLAEPFFRTFTKREICDPGTHTEALLALSCESRREVDDLVRTALAAGARPRSSPSITASCTAGASTTSTATTGSSCGWTRRSHPASASPSANDGGLDAFLVESGC